MFFVFLAAVLSTRLIVGTPNIAMAVVVLSAIVFAAATLIDPNIGLVAILLSMLLSPELEIGSAAGRAVVLRVEDLLLVIVFIAWLARMAVRTDTPLIRKSPLNIPIGLYIAVLLFSTIRGMILGTVVPLKGIFYVFKLIEYFFIFFIVINHTTSKKQIKIFLTAIILTSVIVGIYGNTHIGSVGRISAPFEGEGEPNTLGGYLLFILSILAGLLLYDTKRRNTILLIFLFLVPTFVFTLSRASYLGMMVSMAVFVALAKDKRVLNSALSAFMIFVLAVAFGPPALKTRVVGAFTPEKQQDLKKVGIISLGPSPAARVRSWDLVLKKRVARRPFFGNGVTGVEFLDSQYVLNLSETGFVGLILFLWLMRRIWKASLDTYNRVQDPTYKGLAMGYMVGFAGLLVHAIGSNTFVIIRIAEPFWFFTAIIMKLGDLEKGGSKG